MMKSTGGEVEMTRRPPIPHLYDVGSTPPLSHPMWVEFVFGSPLAPRESFLRVDFRFDFDVERLNTSPRLERPQPMFLDVKLSYYYYIVLKKIIVNFETTNRASLSTGFSFAFC